MQKTLECRTLARLAVFQHYPLSLESSTRHTVKLYQVPAALGSHPQAARRVGCSQTTLRWIEQTASRTAPVLRHEVRLQLM